MDPEFWDVGFESLASVREDLDAVVIAVHKGDQTKIQNTMQQLICFWDRQGFWGTETAKAMAKQTGDKKSNITASSFFRYFGVKAPDLQQVACVVLSQTTAASSCERAWSRNNLVHTKVRNRLLTEKAEMLVYIQLNTLLLDSELALDYWQTVCKWSDDVSNMTLDDMPCWGESAEVEQECVEEVTERITLEEEIEQEQQDQDARVRYGLHGRRLQRPRRFLD